MTPLEAHYLARVRSERSVRIARITGYTCAAILAGGTLTALFLIVYYASTTALDLAF